jgi:phosphatidylglycerol:prolipoprotein diacylglycerol transferase
MLPILNLGPLALPLPGLLALAAYWIGASLAERRASYHKAKPELISNLLYFALIAAILGARLGYALRFPAAFIESPASLISLNLDLLDPWSGLAAALLFALVYGQRKGMDPLPTLDALTPFLASLTLGVALSQLASGAAYGLPSDLPWAIELWGASRHPSQAYDAIAAALILWSVLRGSGAAKPGQTFLNFVLLTAGAQLLLGAFDAATATLPNGWRLSQVGAWLAIVAVLWLQRQDALAKQVK